MRRINNKKTEVHIISSDELSNVVGGGLVLELGKIWHTITDALTPDDIEDWRDAIQCSGYAGSRG